MARSKTLIFCAFLLAMPGAALGQAADQGISVYPSAFFDDARPATARDMINRLPGFNLLTGNTARGFAGTASNVLINGSRPTAKTDDITAILQRIPATSVERIEVIRGGAPGIDMQGQSVLANIIRKRVDSTDTVINANTTFLGSGQWVPNGSLEFHAVRGETSYDLTLSRTAEIWDDAPGNGYRLTIAPGGVPFYERAQRLGIVRVGWSGNGAIKTPLWGGEWANNFTVEGNDFPSTVRYFGNGGSRFDFIGRKKEGEFGSNWQGFIGAVNLEALVLQRLMREENSNTSLSPTDHAIFLTNNDSGESIGRVTARYSLLPNLGLEAGGEVAYNFLDGRTSFTSNGAPVTLPNAVISANERRGEIFFNASWRIVPELSLEAGMRMELSTIEAKGDTHRQNSFFYPKPRALLAWAPDDKSQVRLRAEKVLGQLNFADFVATSNLSGYGVAAGNADLRPEQRWQFEAAAERHFWEKGALVVSVMHEEITDLKDYIPVTPTLDAPGNIAHATLDELKVTGTLPLDIFGLKNGLLKGNMVWWHSEVADPVTGELRRISNQRERNIFFELTQDLEEWDSTWGFSFSPSSFNRQTWRIAQISRIAIHNPFMNAFWSYKPTPDWKIVLGADNFLPYRFEMKQFNYPGARNLGLAPTVRDEFIRTQPRIYLNVRKTF
jgi:outer membrane receptor for ferrienterochelin and colicin